MKQLLCVLAIALISSCTKDELIEYAENDPKKILVDASHDGGVWWFPQGGTYDPASDHQGKKLADLLRAKGFIVDELPTGAVVDASVLLKYDKVIRAGMHGRYTPAALDAYKSFLSRRSFLLLAGEFLRPGDKDELAEMMGLKLAGMARGDIRTFSPHAVTLSASPFYFGAGSVVMNPENRDITPLGWLGTNDFADLNGNDKFDSGEPLAPVVMGIMKHPSARIFFIGDLNCVEQVPQPFTDNMMAWLFK